MDAKISNLPASCQTECFNINEQSKSQIFRKTCVENRGVQTDDTNEVNVFPRSTQTESLDLEEHSKTAHKIESAHCQTDHRETNDVLTQTDSDEIDEIPIDNPRDKPNDCNEPPPSQSTQTEFLTVKGFEKRHQFLLPNLISGTLLALAGIREFQIDHQYRKCFYLCFNLLICGICCRIF